MTGLTYFPRKKRRLDRFQVNWFSYMKVMRLTRTSVKLTFNSVIKKNPKNVHYSISGSDSAAHTSIFVFYYYHRTSSSVKITTSNDLSEQRHRPQKKIILKYSNLLPQTVRLLENGKSFENARMRTTYWCTWCPQSIWCMKFSFSSSQKHKLSLKRTVCHFYAPPPILLPPCRPGGQNDQVSLQTAAHNPSDQMVLLPYEFFSHSLFFERSAASLPFLI